MSESSKCPRCGAALPADGQCLSCLLQMGLGDDEAETIEDGAGSGGREFGEKAGDLVGPYTLIKKLGEGGCGVVWKAEQKFPLRRLVALKVIKPGMDSRQVLARFDAERQALALMDHPNIAKVFDAGATDTGRPYFVMELVQGDRITTYCDAQKRPTRERLKLFVQVCRAIEHAHQKGIIHRDIKPSNVLIAEQDGVAVPKVIDFGIAKATGEQSLVGETIHTAAGNFVGTLPYMSPEQAGSAPDVDTRTDIYSLGVLLYELLTGNTPLTQESFKQSALDVMLRRIREEDPPQPSRRLSESREKLTTISATRQVEPPKLVRLVSGDLDWIVMKSLEKDRTRRYATASHLESEINKHLEGKPVDVSPPSNLYRLQKLVRRNKLVFGATMTVVASLVIGLGFSNYLYLKEREAHNRANIAEKKESELRQEAQRAQFLAEDSKKKAQTEALNSRRHQYAADISAAQNAIKNGNLGLARTILQEYLPRPGAEDLRGFEWHYFERLSQGRQYKSIHGHEDLVYAVSWSPDGKIIASGSWDGTVRLWDVGSEKTIDALKLHDGRITSVTFSPDGKLLATGAEDSRVLLWDIQSRSAILTNMSSSPRVVFSPKDGLIAVASDGTFWGGDGGDIELRDSASGKLVLKLPNAGNRAVFSSDGSLLATANGVKGIVVWNVATGEQMKEARIVGYVLSLAFSPNQNLLAYGTGAGEIGTWDLKDEKPSLLRNANRDWITCVSFSPDGETLAASTTAHTLEFWDISQRKEKDTFFGHGSEVWSVAFSPDGKLIASGGRDAEVMLWKPQRIGKLVQFDAVVDQCLWLGHPLFSDDSRTVAVGDADGRVLLLDAATSLPQNILTNAGLPVAFISNDTRLVTQDMQFKQIQLWEIAGPKRVSSATLSYKKGGWFSGASSHAQTFIIRGALDGSVEIIGIPNGASIAEFRSGISCQTLELSPDDHTLAIGGQNSAGKGAIEIWDLANKKKLWARECHGGPVSVVAFSPNGRMLATGSWDSTLKLWDINSTNEVACLVGHKRGVMRCVFAPDGRTLVSSSDDSTIKFWNLATCREMATFAASSIPHLLRFSPDGATFLSGNDGALQIWRTVSLSEAGIQEIRSADSNK